MELSGAIVMSTALATFKVKRPSSASGSKLRGVSDDLEKTYSEEIVLGRRISKSPKVSGMVMAFVLAVDCSMSTTPGRNA
jgi:hypothetical protein